MASPQPPPTRPRFSLKFSVLSDGLESGRAQALTQAGLHIHGGVFPLFPNLPIELRLKIWEYLLAPRIVGITCLDAEAPPASEDGLEDPWSSARSLCHCDPPAKTPVLLLVNRESRYLALKHYEPAFRWKVPPGLLANPFPRLPSFPASPSPSPFNSNPNLTPTPNSNPNPQTRPEPPSRSPPSVWFSFATDTVYLLGDLEPCDSFGFNSPTVYFLAREEAVRVKRLAVAFAALGYGESGSQHIFGALFHVVDRFAGVETVLVAVVPRDELTHALVGGEGPLVRVGCEGRGGGKGEEVNVVQRIWRDWYRGSIVTSKLARVRFELVREVDLPDRVALPVRAVRDGS
ncbi:uncharacterized protein GGS22DRAFT_145947 [Annulohypoxylon maeteangense]|uniref:uncharacterized protein n=1 Tax=Annulohypoxylon maeteangense TaxID=1927788 RepID=UPI00200826AE|nr:uncharacterized protein GGS22DRAFT_145947 [Annulohypoxylon maeteangense]KAI0884699.1 hypothetical protein GGS22DRAFT_145947 [Annulohypoxylon maeteangense]